MNKNGKKVFTSLAVLAGFASGAGALNAFVNRTVKTMLYRHHKEDDKPSILETKYEAKNIYIKNNQGIKLRGLLIEENEAVKTLVILHPFGLEAKDMALEHGIKLIDGLTFAGMLIDSGIESINSELEFS